MKSVVFLIVGSLFSINAFASMITLETRDLNLPDFDNTDYQQSWADHTTTITSTNLAQFTNLATGNDSFNLLTVDFDFGARDSVIAQFGLDAGYGFAAYLDGNFVTGNAGDRWWSFNWGNSETVPLNSLAGSSHTFELYWAEGCCNGGQSGRFSVDGGNSWQALSVANLDAARVSAVPEPSALLLFGLGLLGLGAVRRKARV